MSKPGEASETWYSGITRYQWFVLFIASLGWIFDVFEGQIFVASMQEAMPSLVPAGTDAGTVSYYNYLANGAFLLGGSLGGILFGMLSDRIGRKKTMGLTILFYSLFTCLSAFAQEWWHLVGLRFLVAMGVGGEWAVASSMVAEVFPRKARAHVGSIFHGSSVFGTFLAIAAGTFLIGNAAVYAWATSPDMAWIAEYVEPSTIPWRLGFMLGVLPAILIIWIRMSLKEPEGWQEARERARTADDPSQQMGRISDLFSRSYLKVTLIGVTLAAAAMATFWGVHIYGKNLLLAQARQDVLVRAQAETPGAESMSEEELLAPHKPELKRWEMLSMLLNTLGGGIGLVAFGPISQRIGRRGAFLLYYLGGFACGLILFGVLYYHGSLLMNLLFLPIFGFMTLGVHAGFAVYFPELYPTRMRGTGTGFCFNAGRLVACPVLLAVGLMQDTYSWFTLPVAACAMSTLFLVGAITLIVAPETRGRELPE